MARQEKKSRYRGLKICCAVTAVLIIILVIVAIVLFLTVFKPRQPKITTQGVTLDNISWVPLTTELNITLGVTVTIHNPNYGSFKYGNSTAYLSYRGSVTAEAPVEADNIPARGNHDISTVVVIEGGKLITNPLFLLDLTTGWLNFTSTTRLQGKAAMLMILKVKATTYSTCDISVQYLTQNVISVCRSNVKY